MIQAIAHGVEADGLSVSDLLCFNVGVERFALPLGFVEEVVDACDVQHTPNAGNLVGVVRVRHELLPVYDAARVLLCVRSQPEPMALVLPGPKGMLLLLIDSAEAAPQVDLAQTRTPPALLAADRVMDGVLRVGAGWVGLLNPAAFIDALVGELSDLSRAGSHGS